MRRNLISLTLLTLGLPALFVTACSQAPHQDVARPNPAPANASPEDVAGIGPRPSLFGRRAWDQQQAAARAKSAGTNVSGTAAAPPAPSAPVVVAAAPPPPPAPVLAPPAPVSAQPPAPLIAAAPPLPAPQPVQPVLPPQPAPVAQTTPVPPAAKPEKAAKTPKAPKAPKPEKEAKPLFGLPFGLKPVQAPPPPPPVAGGYSDATDKKAVEAAAAFAVRESPGYQLKGIYSAKTQVVAGTNYSLCLWVRQVKHEANPLKRRLVAATVYHKLDNSYELTSWREVPECHAGT